MTDSHDRFDPALDSELNYDDPYRQSSVLPYRVGDSGLEILMITSLRRKRWIIPKGIVEPDMTPADSAAKEAFEEAGCEGTVGKTALGKYEYRKWGGTCHVEVFPMQVERVHDAWPEGHLRDREWVAASGAVNRIEPGDLRNILSKFVAGFG